MGYECLLALVCLGLFGPVRSDVMAGGYHISLSDGLTLTRPDGQAVVISLYDLTESDMMGNPLQIPGHSVTLGDFAGLNLTVSDPCSRTVVHSDQVSSYYFYFTADLGVVAPGAKLIVEVFFLTSGGNVVNHNELTRVYPNDIKLTVTVTGWQWCRSCPAQGGGTVDGDHLDLALGLQLPAGGALNDRNFSRHVARVYALGNDMKLSLSRKVSVDGQWRTMADGFPAVVTEGGQDLIRIRLPRFQHMAMYDPVLSLNVSDRTPRAGVGAEVHCSGSGPVGPPYTGRGSGLHGNTAAAVGVVAAYVMSAVTGHRRL